MKWSYNNKINSDNIVNIVTAISCRGVLDS